MKTKEQKLRRNQEKNNAKGITLIALVVTIIVLIILAGVSISMIVGDNGIITQAQRAERETANATVASEEQMNVLVDELNGYLTESEEDEEISGILEEVVSSTNYGDYVDYPIDLNNDGDTTNDWRIFYNDEEHVFIIAADYVLNTSSYLDNVGTGMSTLNTCNLYWNTAPTTAQTVNSSILSLFKQNWTDYSTNENGRCVSTLLNTNNWDGFVNSTYADYAIGGATLEMWVASWNEKGYTQLYTNTNEMGYCVGNTENPETFNYSLLSDSGYNDTLYFPHQSTVDNCYGYWLASPSASYTNYLMNVDCNGNVYRSYYGPNGLGVRPLVCLKSDIMATKGADNIWRF